MDHIIRQYTLEPGALEVEYIEEHFKEFAEKKTAAEIIARMRDREHLILLSMAADPSEPESLIPIAYKIGHQIHAHEHDLQLIELYGQLVDVVNFEDRKIFYCWIGGTREEWRGQGHYRALTEQQEDWAHANGYHELVVKTKNKFYGMRGTLDHLRFDVIKYVPHRQDNRESKVYLGKKLGTEVLRGHQTTRSVVEAA